MKALWMIALVVAAAPARALAAPVEVPLKDDNGKVLAVAVVCNECRGAERQQSKKCCDGTKDGWLGDRRCGDCLLESNWGVLIRYPRDLSVVGRLVKEDGQAAAGHYVKMFLPNGWSVRTQTRDDGTFRMNLGATMEREKGAPLVLDIGERVDRPQNNNEQFFFYLMPDAYNPCASLERSGN